MRRFGLKLLLYVLPVAVYAAVGIGLLGYAGEYTRLESVAAAQAGPQRVLYGRAYKDNYFSYKLISARQRAADLLVLGSSRVMQFRSYLVQPGAGSFYNAGGGAASVFDLRQFLDGLSPAQAPRV